VASEIQKFSSPDAKDVARAELARWRHRLGRLTPDQEVRVEKFLISTATKVSLMSARVMQSLLDCSERNDLPTNRSAQVIGAALEIA